MVEDLQIGAEAETPIPVFNEPSHAFGELCIDSKTNMGCFAIVAFVFQLKHFQSCGGPDELGNGKLTVFEKIIFPHFGVQGNALNDLIQKKCHELRSISNDMIFGIVQPCNGFIQSPLHSIWNDHLFPERLMKNRGKFLSYRKIGTEILRVEKPVCGESIIWQAEIREGHFRCLVLEIQSLRKSCFESGGRVVGKLFRIRIASQRDVKLIHVFHFF